RVWSELSVSPLSVQHVLRVSLRQALGRGFVSFAPPTATPTVPATLCVSVALDTTERRETQLTPPAQVSHTNTHTHAHTHTHTHTYTYTYTYTHTQTHTHTHTA